MDRTWYGHTPLIGIRRDGLRVTTNTAQQYEGGITPRGNHRYRDFSRVNYDHLYNFPQYIPLVRDYEHGTWVSSSSHGTGVPNFNPSIPPPIILNSVSQNQALHDRMARQAETDLGLDQTTLDEFLSRGGGVRGAGTSQDHNMAPSVGPLPHELLESLRSELIAVKAELKAVKEGDVRIMNKSSHPLESVLPEDTQDDNLSAGEGNLPRDFFFTFEYTELNYTDTIYYLPMRTWGVSYQLCRDNLLQLGRGCPGY